MSETDIWFVVAIISRVILAMFWFAIQTVNGGDVVQVMITAIWPSFARVHNSIPESEGITTAQMVSFFICEPHLDSSCEDFRLDMRHSLVDPNPLPLHAP